MQLGKTMAPHKLGKGPGRPKGAANKITREIKEAVCEAFEKAGGVEYLVNIAKTNPTVFCTLLGRVIPQQVNGTLEHAHFVIEAPSPVETVSEWEQQHAPKAIQ